MKRNDDADRYLGAFCERYIKGRTDVSAATRTNYRKTKRYLVGMFGEDRLLLSITKADAKKWKRWLSEQVVRRDTEGKPTATMADATASKHIKIAKMIFSEAVDAKLIDESPMTAIKGGQEVNRERDFFVRPEVAAKVLKACPDHDWKLAFALARFGGLRVCEFLTVKWTDVQFDDQRIRIDSPKTGLRFCPIFIELRPIIDAAAADRENDLVMNRRLIAAYLPGANLGTQMQRIIEAAGVIPWKKTFQNLRASRRTELEERFPGHVIDSWMGHSAKVAAKHYLQVTPDHWEAGATLATTNDTATSGGVPGGVISAAPSQSQSDEDTKKPGKTLGFTGFRLSESNSQMTPTGLEPVLPP
ncbi:tyrosine-type recombinase/integrase [Neorhodopirellula pilleata]|uniref:tyrosine-type recombinase/integrase n=1 Tax=Neorhodopirellula pilleata TaxID=2714738 RepID=UPI0036F405B6